MKSCVWCLILGDENSNLALVNWQAYRSVADMACLMKTSLAAHCPSKCERNSSDRKLGGTFLDTAHFGSRWPRFMLRGTNSV